MNHPTREQWVPYVFGEGDSASRRELTEHLQACPQCRQELNAWKSSLGLLDSWRLPEAETPFRATTPALKWALAAALVLGLGFGLGRLSAASKAGVAALARTEAKAQARQELETDLLMALARENPPAADEFQRRIRDEWQWAIERASDVSPVSAEDRQFITALFDQLRQQQSGEYLSLRRDLETLASVADERLAQNGRQIVQLASRETTVQP